MSKMRGQKRQLEKARQERAAAKRDRRQGRADGTAAGPEDASDTTDGATTSLPEDVVLGQLADLHQRYADGGMELDDFETARAELVAQLRVD